MEEDQGVQNGNFTHEASGGETDDTNREEDQSEKTLTGSPTSVHEKQEIETSEQEKDIAVTSLDSSLVRSDLAEPLLSDEDDHDRLETDKKLRQFNMADVVSDTEISEIPIQDNASDREILDDEVEDEKDVTADTIGSVSDDTEITGGTISEDTYLQYPSQERQNVSNETDTIIQGLAEAGSVISDIFAEPLRRSRESSPSSAARFDSSRSKYTRPRMPPPSYSPYIRPAPVGYYLDDEEVHVSLMIVAITGSLSYEHLSHFIQLNTCIYNLLVR